MNMTHYMQLLATNQPWNLIFYMAIPVVLAETLVATEFFVVYKRLTGGTLRVFNKLIGIVLGVYFLGVFINLMVGVVPHIQWLGWIDVVAVGFYLSGVIPLVGIALLEVGILGRGLTNDGKMRLHFILLTVFLVVAHVAMVFGMLDPTLTMGTGVETGHGHNMKM
ncbi:MAG TPA: cytochrome oxidase biogenesis protein Surf12C [Pelotomaculum sp.]|nr:cytochrome oxidase biogenesis protein Surf12C [Pelotomaculum sp.]